MITLACWSFCRRIQWWKLRLECIYRRILHLLNSSSMYNMTVHYILYTVYTIYYIYTGTVYIYWIIHTVYTTEYILYYSKWTDDERYYILYMLYIHICTIYCWYCLLYIYHLQYNVHCILYNVHIPTVYMYYILYSLYIIIGTKIIQFYWGFSNIALIIIIMILFPNSLHIVIFHKDTLPLFDSFVYVSIITSLVFVLSQILKRAL